MHSVYVLIFFLPKTNQDGSFWSKSQGHDTECVAQRGKNTEATAQAQITCITNSSMYNDLYVVGIIIFFCLHVFKRTSCFDACMSVVVASEICECVRLVYGA